MTPRRGRHLGIHCMLALCISTVSLYGCDDVEDIEDIEDIELEEEDEDVEFRGVSALEYCATLDMILANNPLSRDAQFGAAIGWNHANCNQFSPVELWNNWPTH
ncbi:MAG: hypothetical protein AAF799_19830 [Myxococcota bacterium]